MLKNSLIFSFLVCTIIACNNPLSIKEKEQYTKKGNKITKESFKELSGHLMQQMKLGGPNQAVPFCNLQATPITNQLSKKFNVTIKRTSDKIRNTQNKATKRELEIIEKYKVLLKNKSELKPIVEIDANNKKHYYAPIKLNKKCLVCHGKLENKLSIKTDSLIKSLYPKDKAFGYKAGELRGIWSVIFNN